jgi:hypothetical protein
VEDTSASDAHGYACALPGHAAAQHLSSGVFYIPALFVFPERMLIVHRQWNAILQFWCVHAPVLQATTNAPSRQGAHVPRPPAPRVVRVFPHEPVASPHPPRSPLPQELCWRLRHLGPHVRLVRRRAGRLPGARGGTIVLCDLHIFWGRQALVRARQDAAAVSAEEELQAFGIIQVIKSWSDTVLQAMLRVRAHTLVRSHQRTLRAPAPAHRSRHGRSSAPNCRQRRRFRTFCASLCAALAGAL